MNHNKCRSIGSLWAIGHGLLSAVVPQLSVKLTKKMLGKNFENAEKLEARPKHVRQIRALGIGLAAAGAANLAMDRLACGTDDD
jgi:hypothetical protein